MSGPRLRLGLTFFAASRDLLRSRTIAALLVGAVAAGVAFQIPNTANVLGYEREIIEQGVTAGFGDVRVRPRKGQLFTDGDGLARRLGARPGTEAAVPILTLPGAVDLAGALKGTVMFGVDSRAARLPFQLSQGRPLEPGDRGHLIIADALAARIRAGLGQVVQVRIIFGQGRSLTDDVGRYALTIQGVARVSFVSPEGIVLDRAFLAGELGEPGAASAILVHLRDHFAARAEARRIAAELPEVEAVAWADDVPFLESALAGSRAVSAISQVMVVFAVMLPVWALLHLHVLHRRRDLGLLASLGFRRSEVFAIFLLEALLVAAAGIAIGCAGGLGLIEWFKAHPVFQTGSFVIRPVMTWTAFARPALTVLLAVLAAGAVPAALAAREDAARILRGIE
jgi:ABC-type lipoprotein release transport system permease subunit